MVLLFSSRMDGNTKIQGLAVTALPIITFKSVPAVERADEVGSCQTCHRPSALLSVSSSFSSSLLPLVQSFICNRLLHLLTLHRLFFSHAAFVGYFYPRVPCSIVAVYILSVALLSRKRTRLGTRVPMQTSS